MVKPKVCDMAHNHLDILLIQNSHHTEEGVHMIQKEIMYHLIMITLIEIELCGILYPPSHYSSSQKTWKYHVVLYT